MAWRDYRNMSDEELDHFLQTFPSHVDYQAAMFEHQRRRVERNDQQSIKRHEELADLTANTLWWAKAAAWATVGIGVIAIFVEIIF